MRRLRLLTFWLFPCAVRAISTCRHTLSARERLDVSRSHMSFHCSRRTRLPTGIDRSLGRGRTTDACRKLARRSRRMIAPQAQRLLNSKLCLLSRIRSQRLPLFLWPSQSSNIQICKRNVMSARCEGLHFRLTHERRLHHFFAGNASRRGILLHDFADQTERGSCASGDGAVLFKRYSGCGHSC